ncbi:hypothetical protein [Vibrio sp. B181a]|uniref:hypothetical protein n=1 Tax=Vibrio sp. B181a TaxID=2835906 RepID=UPI00255794F3|nr:hypothetical protein [Vibrio sp. B181a]MDK9774311.1 hypothetical protein [Vibrio sp. B181a]
MIHVGPEPIDNHLSIDDVANSFEGFISKADGDINDFLAKHTKDGQLEITAPESLELQKLMANQSIAAQAGTSTLKGVKDSIAAAARNI